jgi:hypothetical protein
VALIPTLRYISDEELAVLLDDARQEHHILVQVRDANGDWVSLTDAEGRDWVESGDVDSERLDQPVGRATINLRRDGPLGVSLAPLMTESPLNILDAAFAPLLDIGSAVRVLAVVVPPGTPVEGSYLLTTEDGFTLITEDGFEFEIDSIDYEELFLGRIDRIAWESDPIVLTCADQGAWLMDTQIEETAVYGSVVGTPVEDVMQEILDDWPSVLGSLMLAVPVSPGWLIHEYQQDRVKVLEAIRALAQQIGWDVRFQYDEFGEFVLTLFEVDRANVTPAAAVGPSSYSEVRALALELDNIRNVVFVPYFDVDGAPQVESAQDAASITKLGRRFMEIQESSSSNIDTAAEALALAEAAVSDLSAPPLTHEIEMPLFWCAQFGALLSLSANGTHYDEDQLLGIVGVRHAWRDGHGMTSLSLAGRIKGAYRDWLSRGANRVIPIAPFLNAEMTLQDTTATITFTGGPFVEGRTDDGEFIAVSSPVVIARNAVRGRFKEFTLRAYAVRGRSDVQEQTFIVPVQEDTVDPPASPSVFGVGVFTADYPGDGGGSCSVSWSEANMPGGHKINIIILLDQGISSFLGPGAAGPYTQLNVGASPFVFSLPMGPDAPGGVVTVQAVSSADAELAQAQHTGPFSL